MPLTNFSLLNPTYQPKSQRKVKPLTKGFTLMEILISMAIFSVLTIMLLLSIGQLLKRQAISSQLSLASFSLQQTMEALYSLTQTDQWDSLTPENEYYIQVSTGSIQITNTPPDVDYPATVYIDYVYRQPSTNDIDPSCTASPPCIRDPDIKKVTVQVDNPLNPDQPLTAVNYLTTPEILTSTGPTPTPLPDQTGLSSNPNSIDIRAVSDDATQLSGGAVNIGSNTITLGGSGQWAGLSFANSQIPAFSTIYSAYIVGQSNGNFDQAPSTAGDLYTIWGDATLPSTTFTSSSYDISSRPRTVNFTDYHSVLDDSSWTPDNWYRLGDVTDIVQELINGPWSPTNALTFLFQSRDVLSKTIYAYTTTNPARSPNLVVIYASPTPAAPPPPSCTDDWTTGMAGGTPRSQHTGVAYNGKIYFWGGNNGMGFGGNLNIMDIYDIATDSWSVGSPGGTAKTEGTAALVGGKIYYWAGNDYGCEENIVDVYDIATNSWSSGPRGGNPRRDSSGTVYNNRIYYWSGYDTFPVGCFGPGVDINTMDIFNPATGAWTTGAAGGTARQGASSAVWNNRIYYFGGWRPGDDVMDIYNPATNSWSTGAPSGTVVFNIYQNTPIYRNKFIYWGGHRGGSGPTNDLTVYDPVSNSWSSGEVGGTPRAGYASALYNNSVYYWGGSTDGSNVVNTLDIYNPACDPSVSY